MVMLVGLLPVKTSAGEADRTITTLGELQQWAAEVNAGNSYRGEERLPGGGYCAGRRERAVDTDRKCR